MGVGDQGIEVWSGRTNTWECDQMGHLNARFHIAKSIEALASFAAELGMPRAFAPTAESTLIVREQHVRFLREARPTAGLSITGSVTAIGECAARLLLVMRHTSGEPASTFQTTVEHVTAREARPFPWPARVVERAQALLGEVPAFATARGLDLGPAPATASLERAQALQLRRTAVGVVGPAECDAFGRMRPELFIGRISDGLPNLFDGRDAAPAPGAPQPRIGGAALEYRLVHRAWPRAGDRVAVFGGISEANERTRRMVHWMLDPDSGQVWAAADAVAAGLDLETRKLAVLSPAALAAVQAQVTPGLTL